MAPNNRDPERQALLPSTAAHTRKIIPRSQSNGQRREQKVDFEKDDPEHPYNFPAWRKRIQITLIFFIALLPPLASSIASPALSTIQEEFQCSRTVALLGQSLFVTLMGLGPLIHAPMSETFGRRPIFLGNLIIFTVLQIPTALAGNVQTWLVLRALGGFFGSVGVANGGGSVGDMYSGEMGRARVLGVYLVAPLLGPTLGPFLGASILSSHPWRLVFWITFLLSTLITLFAYFLLLETRSTTILQMRKSSLEESDRSTNYYVEGVSDDSVFKKILGASTRAIRILTTQPIVMTMSLYQALIFSGMYSLYSSYTKIFSAPPYEFSILQIGLAYLVPAVGFILTAGFVVAYIDELYDWLSKKNDDEGRPEYRLPMANIGAVLLPISLFWFGWAVEKQLSWPVTLAAMLLFGASQVSIFNTVQTYYIDSFESNAASALAAGAFLRSMVGGIVPLFVSGMFDQLGYGLGMSVFGGLGVILMPAPMLFYWYGRQLREKFPFKA